MRLAGSGLQNWFVELLNKTAVEFLASWILAEIGTILSMASFLTTVYFRHTRRRPDRAGIQDEWILRAIQAPIREEIQSDGRIRRWARISEFENRVLRVILLPDVKTVHNAFFDRDFAH